MVKFVAKTAVNINSLSQFSLIYEGSISNTSSSGFRLKDGNARLDVGGTGFKYDNTPFGKVPTQGTVKTLDGFASGNALFEITKLNVDVTVAANWETVKEATNAILGGKDTIIGSNKGDTLRGFGGDDTIKGKKGKDTLIGDGGKDNLEGGKGNDELKGGKGKDNYIFKDSPNSGVDTISKFESGEKIKLDNADFGGIGGNGQLKGKFFVQGSNAKDGNDHIIYKKSDGKIYYDADGKGGADQVLFAKVKPGTNLDNGDFIVI